ncbi:MAG: GNAT family N-acetyltransferase [Bacteroidales bacterium]|nr:GNAT family N-acetyltransferase [Bacteroidales bacterium]
MEYIQTRLSNIQVLSLLKRCDKEFTPCLSEDLDLDNYSKKLSEHASFIIAKEDNEIQGFVAYYKNFSESFLYVPLVWVSSSSRRSGLGKTFISQLERLDPNVFLSIKLEVLKSNAGAYQFYLKENFKIAEERDSKWLMSKNI